MLNQKIAVVGDKDSVLAFKSIGIDVFSPDCDQETANLLGTLTKQGYAVIFITESKAQSAQEAILQSKTKAYPIILPIPDASGSNGFGLRGLKYNVEKAIGMDIVFNKEENE